MSHQLSAEQIWLKRCNQQTTVGITVWPDWPLDSLAAIIETNHNEWIAYLDQVTEDELTQTLHYQNSTGAHFDSVVSDMITQVINHGTHTRAQIGMLLKQNEADKLPLTDYIFYARETPALNQ